MTESAAGPFVGSWTLIPESVAYEQGPDPVSEVHVISAEAGKLRLTATWTDANGMPGHISHLIGFSPTERTFATFVDSRSLAITTTNRGRTVGRSVMQLSSDGSQLFTAVSGIDEEGQPFVNRATFNRTASP